MPLACSKQQGSVTRVKQVGRSFQACDAISDHNYPRQRRALRVVGVVVCTAVNMDSFGVFRGDDGGVSDVAQSCG